MTDATYQPFIIVRHGLWRTFSAAFTSASLIRPPPMTSHMFDRASNVGTLFSTAFDNDAGQTKLTSPRFMFFNKFLENGAESVTTIGARDHVNVPRIAIIGGGIAGVTAASALVKGLDKENKSAKIVLFEQDIEGGQRSVDFGDCQQPIWSAGE